MSSGPDGGGAPSRVVRWEDWVGGAALGLMAAITFANVLARYFTNQSFAWTEEISIALMVVLTLVAASVAIVRDRHIRIEFFYSGGSAARRRLLGIFSALATILAFAILAWMGGRLAWDDYRYEVTSPGIGVPQWWYTVTLPVFAAVCVGRAVQRLAALVRPRN